MKVIYIKIKNKTAENTFQSGKDRLLVRRHNNGESVYTKVASSSNVSRPYNRLFWYWKERRWFVVERFWSWADRRWRKSSTPNRPMEHEFATKDQKRQATYTEKDYQKRLLVRRYNNGGLGSSGQGENNRLNSTGILLSFRLQGGISAAILPSHSDITICHPEFSSGSKNGNKIPNQVRDDNDEEFHYDNVSDNLIQVKPSILHLRHFEPKGELEARAVLMIRQHDKDGITRRVVGLFVLLLIAGISSCKKFVEIPPPQTALTNSSVFSSNSTANAAQLAIYSNFAGNVSFYLSSNTGESADEFIAYPLLGSDEISLSENELLSNNGNTYVIWSSLYALIYQSNLALDALATSSSISSNVNHQLTGEAKYSRALMYFYLVNLFGDVPLVITSHYSNSAQAARATKDKIYQQIVSDLKDAQDLVNKNYVGADGVTQISTSKLRPNRAVVRALLSRVYLYMNDYQNSQVESSYIIDSCNYHLVPDLNKVFLINSDEAIFQITYPPVNSADGYLYISQNTARTINPLLLNSFEDGDQRKTAWIDSLQSGFTTYYYPYKYKVSSASAPITELTTLFRLSEQYLIRAEAEAHQSNYTAAINDLNMIRNRAGLGNYGGSTNNETEILSAILHERRVEFFSEGHRWLDIKRTSSVDSVMKIATPLKGGVQWNTIQQLWPIPQSEIVSDPYLTQNTGY